MCSLAASLAAAAAVAVSPACCVVQSFQCCLRLCFLALEELGGLASGLFQGARGVVAPLQPRWVCLVLSGVARLLAAAAAGCSAVAVSLPCCCSLVHVGSLLPCSVRSNIPFHISSSVVVPGMSSSAMEDGLSCCCCGAFPRHRCCFCAIRKGLCVCRVSVARCVCASLLRRPPLHEALVVWWGLFAGPATLRSWAPVLPLPPYGL